MVSYIRKLDTGVVYNIIQGSPDVEGLSAPPSSGLLCTCENDAELVPQQ